MRLSSSALPYVLAVAALLAIAYSNHFRNGFHFDDSHSIEDNTYVRELKYIPRYFTDANVQRATAQSVVSPRAADDVRD
jgi:protein O-mannosyl-transferase